MRGKRTAAPSGELQGRTQAAPARSRDLGNPGHVTLGSLRVAGGVENLASPTVRGVRQAAASFVSGSCAIIGAAKGEEL